MSTIVIPTVQQIEEAIDRPASRWAGNCHAISLALVRSGLLGEPGPACRVARGFAEGVRSQHSWVVVGPGGPYDYGSHVIDPTLWSAVDVIEPEIWDGPNYMYRHVPHGASGPPHEYPLVARAEGNVVELTPDKPLTKEAEEWLKLWGPFDIKGWAYLAHVSPMAKWPARDILDAMYCTDLIRPYIPLDIAGMATDRNPKELYW